MGTLPNWLFSMNYFLITGFAIVLKNLFLLVTFSLLRIKSLINNLIFVLERSNIDESKISHTHQHITCICDFDAAWVSFRETFSTFISESASNLMKSILHVEFIFLRIMILMIIVSFVTGAIICLWHMAKWSIIRIILRILPHICVFLNMSTKMLFVFIWKGFKITFVFQKFDDSLL